MQIVADQHIPGIKQVFSEMGELLLYNGYQISPHIIRDADLLLVRSVTPINADLLEGSQVKFVGTVTSGSDHLDTTWLNSAGIRYANVSGSNARSVAEYVLSSLCIIADQQAFALQGMNVGIIGGGNVGSQLSKLLNAIGMHCMVNDPPLKNNTVNNRYCELDEIFQADIITLHVPLTKTGDYPTSNMVNTEFLKRLNTARILINTSRGGVIDEEALKAYYHPKLSLVLDVWQNEPEIDTELLSNATIGTPHIAGYSADGKYRGVAMIYHKVCDFFGLQPKPLPFEELLQTDTFEFTPSSKLSDIEIVQMSILASYDVRSDSAFFRQILGESAADERSNIFKELRNNYPVRREFPALTVNIPTQRQQLIAQLSKLGFNVNSA